ncbi:MAG: porin, partial [Pseudomonadota bacterium]|nr:porin [Pseudomonadota bacterium]
TRADAGGITPGAASRSADSFTVGAIHSLSKRTSLFGGYQHVYVDGGSANTAGLTAQPTYATGNRATYTIGVRHNF